MKFPPYPLKLPFNDPLFDLDPNVPEHHGLSAEAKAIFAALGAYHGPDLTGFELIDRMTQDTGMTTVTVIRHLSELKRAGVVS